MAARIVQLILGILEQLETRQFELTHILVEMVFLKPLNNEMMVIISLLMAEILTAKFTLDLPVQLQILQSAQKFEETVLILEIMLVMTGIQYIKTVVLPLEQFTLDFNVEEVEPVKEIIDLKFY